MTQKNCIEKSALGPDFKFFSEESVCVDTCSLQNKNTHKRHPEKQKNLL